MLSLRLLSSAELLGYDFDVPCSVLRTDLRQYSQTLVISWISCACIDFDAPRSFKLLQVFF